MAILYTTLTFDSGVFMLASTTFPQQTPTSFITASRELSFILDTILPPLKTTLLSWSPAKQSRE